MTSQKWWKIKPLSRETGIAVSTLYRWISDGTLEPRYVRQLPSKTMVVDINGLFRKRPKKKKTKVGAKANATTLE